MGFRFSLPSVFARLTTGAVLSGCMLLGGPAPVAAHAMTPAFDSNTQFQTLPDVLPPGPPFSCQKAGAPINCYGPAQIRAAYDVQALLDSGVTGKGQTIAIIDAFQDPMLQADFDLFNKTWGFDQVALPTPVAPDGLTPFVPNKLQVTWAREIALDVEWAHVIAPGATLQLVLAKSEQDADVLSATKYAIDHKLGNVISMSFSEAESCPTAQFLAGQHHAFQRAVEGGMTLVAASGDAGAAQPTCDGTLVAGAGTPASDPLVTAVGGTRLVADLASGAYQSEVSWADQFGASGGGFSTIYRRPGYQARAVTGSKMRGLPDVAWSADAFGASLVVALGQLGASPGTSGPTAQWAGIAALLGQARGDRHEGSDGSSLNSFLYRVGRGHAYHSVMHDITVGNSSFKGFTGFSAGAGWDPVTGLGTPDVAKLVGLVRDGEDHGGNDGGDNGGDTGGNGGGEGNGDGGGND